MGKGFVRKPPKRADYLLYYQRGFPLGVVEAKAAWKTAGAGLQQAKEYAEMLGLIFAYATNGHEIIEFDYFIGKRNRDDLPTPVPMSSGLRYRLSRGIKDDRVAEKLLTPINTAVKKGERYYAQIAINRAIEGIVQGIIAAIDYHGDRHRKNRRGVPNLLETLECPVEPHGRIPQAEDPLSGRPQLLVDQPEGRHFRRIRGCPPQDRIRRRSSKGARCISPSIRLSLVTINRAALHKEFPRDFFDLVIVDECHRGSARDDSNWREILEWFEPAYQLGMTATPLREDNRDTYLYFGNPIYQYSLRQGIEDGFLAPYRVHRIISEWDAAGWRPSKDELDRYGRAIPDEEYGTKDFERVGRAACPHRSHRPPSHGIPEKDRSLRQNHRLLRGSGTRRRNAACHLPT